jgi:hypothetical protein
MQENKYYADPWDASDHVACESRIGYLARAAAELADYYEGVNFTLKRQRDAAHAELRKLKGAA